MLYDLAGRADVFLTSFLPSARHKFGIDVADIRAVNPRIVYARGSALGPRGAESDRGGYDMTAFWCRGTSAASLTPPNVPGLISPPPAYGDTISGTNLAGGIAAALLRRERTGEPSVVDVSLLGSGLWTMGHALACPCASTGPGRRRRPACTAPRPTRCPACTARPMTATCPSSCSSPASSGPTSARTWATRSGPPTPASPPPSSSRPTPRKPSSCSRR